MGAAGFMLNCMLGMPYCSSEGGWAGGEEDWVQGLRRSGACYKQQSAATGVGGEAGGVQAAAQTAVQPRLFAMRRALRQPATHQPHSKPG